MLRPFEELNRWIQSVDSKEKGETTGGTTSKRPRNSGHGDSIESLYHGKSIYELSEADCRAFANGTSNGEHQHEEQTPLAVTRLRILEVWKQLMKVLVEKHIFWDQIKNIKQGFISSTGFEPTASNNPDGIPSLGLIHASDIRHVETLVRLLVHTAEHVDRDNSTECRFATLLEILLSYTPQWVPSEEVARLWIRLMQRVPYQCAPTNFRRKAYRVLVSLSWVPSSKGLLAACSIPERSMRVAPLPKASQTYRCAVVSTQPSKTNTNNNKNGSTGGEQQESQVTIPRHDSVNQLLDRLKDETDVCVALTSTQPGIGKSTLASLVVSHPSIQKSFFVVWIRLVSPTNISNGDTNASESHNSKSHNMSFETYRDHIIQIRDQIREQQGSNDGEKEIDFTFPTCEERFEEPAVRQLREEQTMALTKESVAKELKALQNPNLLLVLENVTSDAQIPLFRFHDKQSLIITTAEDELKNVDWQVELDPISCEEAVDLFLGHAGLPPSHPLGQTPELQFMLEDQCQYLPLTIRTVGRWCRLKSVAAGPIRACIEIMKEMEELATDQQQCSLVFEGAPDAKRFLFDILSLMIGPSQRNENDGTHGMTSAVFVVCLAAMAVVFPAGKRVPLDVVLLLWEQILLVEPVVANEVSALIDLRSSTPDGKNGKSNTNREKSRERRQFVGMIAQGLLHMGMVEIYEVDNNTWIEIHHQIYSEFAWTMAKGLDLGESSFERTVQKWHKAFVTSYFEQRIQKNIAIEAVGGVNSLDYAVRFLPTHIFHASMMKMGETMLVDTRFFEIRVKALGWERAVEIHIQDCLRLQSGFLEYSAYQASRSSLNGSNSGPSSSSSLTSGGGTTNSSDLLVVSPVFSKSSAMITSFLKNNGSNTINEDRSDRESDDRRVTAADVSTALYRMAFGLAGHGYFEEALSQFSAAQKLVPELGELQASIMYGIAWVLLVSGDSKRALRKITSALKTMTEQYPQHLLYKEARQLHVDTMFERCDYKKALEVLNEIEADLMKESDENMIELGAVLKKRGCLLHVMGKAKDAAAAFTQAIEWKEMAQECSYGLASCYCQLGDVNMELHALSGIKDNFERAVSTLVDSNCDKEHVSYLVATGKLYFSRSDFARCFEALEAARNAIQVAPLYIMDQSAYDLRCIARTYRARGDSTTAIEILRESLTLTAHRPNSLERATCLRELGRYLLEADQSDDEGIACLKEALSIIGIALGHCSQLFELMNTIALVHKMRCEYDDSLKVLAKASSILETIAPDDTEKEANIYFSIGDVEEKRGNFNEALGAYTQATEIIEQTHASDDPLFAKVHECMGSALKASNRLVEARENLEVAVRIRSHHFDERALAESKFSLGVVLRKLGSIPASEKLLKESLAYRERNEGSHDHVATLFEIGNIYLLSNPVHALTFYQDCVSKLDVNDVLLGDVYQAMGHVKFFEVKEDEAIQFYRLARDVRQIHYGQEHSKTANSLRGIGMTQLFFRRKADAEKTLESLCQICGNLARKAASSTSDLERKVCATRDYILAIIFLGDAYYANRKKQEAVSLWNKARSIFEQAQLENMSLQPELRDIYEHRLASDTQGGKASPEHEQREAQALASMIYVDD